MLFNVPQHCWLVSAAQHEWADVFLMINISDRICWTPQPFYLFIYFLPSLIAFLVDVPSEDCASLLSASRTFPGSERSSSTGSQRKLQLVTQEVLLVIQKEIVATLLLLCVLENMKGQRSRESWHTLQQDNLGPLWPLYQVMVRVCTLMELSLLILGLKLFGSLLNVISSRDKNLFIPASRLWGLRKRERQITHRYWERDGLRSIEFLPHVLAAVCLDGMPSNTMTLSARYVAMMKSCSTTNAVFLAWRIYL